MATLPHSRVAPRMACAVLALACLQASPVIAKTESYRLDPVHTRVIFQVSHAGFSNQPGFFSGIDGSLQFDPQDWSKAALRVRIPIRSLQLGDPKWNQRVLDRTFLDAGKFPEAVFESTLVEPTGSTTAQVTGNLTMHGVTHPVTLAVTLNALRRHPLTFMKTAGFSATATLRRSDFGMAPSCGPGRLR